MKGENDIPQTENEFESVRKSRRAVALLRHFFPVSCFRRYERMHKYTLPVNKISRPHKKDSRAVYRTSCATVVPCSLAIQPHPVAIFFLSLLVALFYFSPPPLSLSLSFICTLTHSLFLLQATCL